MYVKDGWVNFKKRCFLRIRLVFDSHIPVRYLERFRTFAVKLFISCYLCYVLPGRPPNAVAIKGVTLHLSKTIKRPRGPPLGITIEGCGFRQGSVLCILMVPQCWGPGKWKPAGPAGDFSAQGKHTSFRGFSSAIQKREGCSNCLPGPFPSESQVLKRLEPVSSPTRTPGCDLGLTSVGGEGGASGSDTVPAPPLPPSLAC